MMKALSNLNHVVVLILLVVWGQSVASKEPMRIVSLAQSLTQNLYYLESDSYQLIGCTSYCKPKKNTEVVASAVTVNIEKVLTLKPDLVVVTSITKPKTIDKLRDLGIRVELFPTPRNFNEICTQFVELGKLIGATEKADSIVKRSVEKVESLRKKIKPGQSPRMFIQIGANPLYSVYPDLFMNDYFLFAGAKNIASDFKMGSITREAVMMRNPEIIFVVTMGIVGNEEKQIWEKQTMLSASKNKKIFLLDSDEACTPTPVTFAKTLEAIIHSTYSK
jgi:ABC-type Fe3+-hydroxamate transport system substrate-binding protein